MVFQQDLLDLNGLFNFSDLNTFTHNIPPLSGLNLHFN